MPKLELLLLGVPLVAVKRPFADGASDVMLVEEPNPEKPVALEDLPLDASLFAVVPKTRPVELAFEAGSLVKMVLEPNRPPFVVAFEMPLLEYVLFEPNGLRDGDLVVVNKLPLEGGWVDALLVKGAEFEPYRLPPRDSVLC